MFGKTASRLMTIGRSAPDDEYRALHNALTIVYETPMSLGAWPATLKAALNLIGLPAGVPREPVRPLAPAETGKLAALFDELDVQRASI